MSCLDGAKLRSLKGLGCTGSDKELPNVTSIAEVNGKVIITLDNGLYLSASMEVVDKDLNANIEARQEMDALKEKVSALETALKLFNGNIITIADFEGTETHKAISLTYTPTNV